MTTRYEIAAAHRDGRHFLIGYTPRRSLPGLLAAMRNAGAAIIDALAIGEADMIDLFTRPSIHATVSNGWTVRFSGRTQREAETLGELPWVGDAKAA